MTEQTIDTVTNDTQSSRWAALTSGVRTAGRAVYSIFVPEPPKSKPLRQYTEFERDIAEHGYCALDVRG